MLKKKVLLFGDLGSLSNFFASGYVMEYDPVAMVTDNAEMLYLTPSGNLPKIDVVSRKNVPNFVYKMVDAIVLLDKKNQQDDINFLLQRGVEPKKIIAWDMYGGVEILSGQQNGESLTMMEGLEFHPRNVEDQNFIAQIRQMLRNQKVFFAFNPQAYPQMLANNFYQMFKRPLNWNNLSTFAEKICWLKLFDVTPLKTRLTDKYLSRYFVAEKIGDDYLTPLLGVWDNVDEIDFEFLPERFLLRCNHAPNFYAVVDKKTINVRELREKFAAMMQVDFSAQYNFELQYSKIKRKIFAEEILDGNVAEYKFLCFNGQPQFCRHANIYFDMDWDVAEFEKTSNIPTPKNFSAMKKLARKLCGDFAFVRVDFKEIGGRIYFDAFEFTPNESLAADKTFGDLLTLTNTPPRLPEYNPADYTIFKKRYSPKLHFTHPERVTFPKVEPCNGRVIVMLSSWTGRIKTTHLTIQSIIEQTLQPDLIVLYLFEGEFPNREKDLPQQLTALLSDKFEIHWVDKDTRYYKRFKAFEEFPEDIIASVDDDMVFNPKWLASLLEGYRKRPDCIQCPSADAMQFDDSENLKVTYNTPYDCATHLHLPTGWLGILYPPHSIRVENFKDKDLLSIIPSVGDHWSGLMGTLNGFRVNIVDCDFEIMSYIPGTQDVAINKIGKSKNKSKNPTQFTQINNVFREYPGVKEILLQEWQNAKPD